MTTFGCTAGWRAAEARRAALVHDSARVERASPILMLIGDVPRKRPAQQPPHHIRTCLDASDPKSAVFAYQITAAFGSDFTLSCRIV